MLSANPRSALGDLLLARTPAKLCGGDLCAAWELCSGLWIDTSCADTVRFM
ncbi:unnamed protein product, partial [Ectocarpus sp. 12 AP-2014]